MTYWNIPPRTHFGGSISGCHDEISKSDLVYVYNLISERDEDCYCPVMSLLIRLDFIRWISMWLVWSTITSTGRGMCSAHRAGLHISWGLQGDTSILNTLNDQRDSEDSDKCKCNPPEVNPDNIMSMPPWWTQCWNRVCFAVPVSSCFVRFYHLM